MSFITASFLFVEDVDLLIFRVRNGLLVRSTSTTIKSIQIPCVSYLCILPVVVAEPKTTAALGLSQSLQKILAGFILSVLMNCKTTARQALDKRLERAMMRYLTLAKV